MADGSIKIDTKIDSSSLPKQLRSMETAVKKSTSAMGESFAKMRDVMQGPIAAFQLLKQGFDAVWGSTVGQAAKIEDMTAAFTPLVGGADNARAMIQALNKEAATTPFELEGIGKVAKQLLPVLGNDIEAVTGTFRMLGDTAGGNIEKLDSITRGYVKVMNTGKVSLEALNMISDAGVPIQTQLAESMGMTVQEMYKLITAGEVSSSELTKAFEKMTSEGGLFYKGMDIASQTLSGRLSTMQDSFKMAGAAIGDVFLPVVKSIVTAVSDVVGGFAAWAKENDNLATTLKMIVAIGVGVAIAAIVKNIGMAIEAINAMKVAIMALNTNALFGPTGIIVALGLMTAALIAASNADRQAGLKRIEEQFGALAKEAGMSAEKIQEAGGAFIEFQRTNATLEETAFLIKEGSKQLGITEDQFVRIGLAADNLTNEYKEQIRQAQKYNEELSRSNKYIIGTKEWIEAQKELAAATKTTGKTIETVSADAAKLALDWSDKLRETALSNLEKEKKAAIQAAKDKNESAEDVAAIAKKYDDEILSANLKSIEAQRTASIKEAKEKKADAETVANINKYYDEQITTFKEGQTNERVQLEKDYTKKFSDENEKRTQDTAKTITDWMSSINTLSVALESVIGEDMSNLISGFTNIGTNIASVFETGGTSITAWAGLAASLITGVLSLFAKSDRASEVSARLAEEAAEKAKEASSALTEVLQGGKSSYEAFLGLRQAKLYLEEVASASEKASSSLDVYHRMYKINFQSYYNELMSMSRGTMSVAEATDKAKKYADQMASSFKMESDAAKKHADSLQKVYDTVYDGNIVTAKTSNIMAEWADKLEEVIETTGDASTETAALNEYYRALTKNALYPVSAALEENNAELAKNAGLWTDATKATYAFEASLSSLREKAASFYESFANIGSDIADTLVSSLTDGLDETSFLDAMKEYITKMVIQAAVYTEALTDKIAKIGKKIASAIAGGLTGNSLSGIKQELADLYAEASGKASAAMDIVNGAFAGNAGVASIASGLGSSLTPSVATTGGSNVTVTVNAVNTTVLDGRTIAVSVAENIDSVVAAI